jgi:flagellar biogenesis protein FliO
MGVTEEETSMSDENKKKDGLSKRGGLAFLFGGLGFAIWLFRVWVIKDLRRNTK